jgi:putative peptidoglycan lipid II flippase
MTAELFRVAASARARSTRALGWYGPAAGVTVAAVAGQAPGFILPIAIAWLVGANPETDAFFLVFALTTFAATPLIATAQDVALPFIVANREAGGDRAKYLAGAASTMLLIASIAGAVLVIAGPMLLRGAGGLSGPYLGLATELVWWFAAYTVATTAASLGVGALNAEGAHVRAALSPGLRSVIVLGFLLAFSGVSGVKALAYGYLAGEVCRAWYLRRALGSLYGRSIGLSRPPRALLGFARQAAAQILGSAAIASMPLIDRFWAGGLEAGSVSILDYAERLWQVPLGFLLSGVLIVALSRWSSQLHQGGDSVRLAADTRTTALVLSAASVPFCAIGVVWRVEIVGWLFASGAFPVEHIPALANTVGVFLAGIPVYVAGLVYARALLVLRRSDVLLGVALVQVCCKVVLNSILVAWWGVPGIAVATIVTFGTGSILLMVAVRVLVRAWASAANRGGPHG